MGGVSSKNQGRGRPPPPVYAESVQKSADMVAVPKNNHTGGRDETNRVPDQAGPPQVFGASAAASAAAEPGAEKADGKLDDAPGTAGPLRGVRLLALSIKKGGGLSLLRRAPAEGDGAAAGSAKEPPASAPLDEGMDSVPDEGPESSSPRYDDLCYALFKATHDARHLYEVRDLLLTCPSVSLGMVPPDTVHSVASFACREFRTVTCAEGSPELELHHSSALDLLFAVCDRRGFSERVHAFSEAMMFALPDFLESMQAKLRETAELSPQWDRIGLPVGVDEDTLVADIAAVRTLLSRYVAGSTGRWTRNGHDKTTLASAGTATAPASGAAASAPLTASTGGAPATGADAAASATAAASSSSARVSIAGRAAVSAAGSGAAPPVGASTFESASLQVVATEAKLPAATPDAKTGPGAPDGKIAMTRLDGKTAAGATESKTPSGAKPVVVGDTLAQASSGQNVRADLREDDAARAALIYEIFEMIMDKATLSLPVRPARGRADGHPAPDGLEFPGQVEDGGREAIVSDRDRNVAARCVLLTTRGWVADARCLKLEKNSIVVDARGALASDRSLEKMPPIFAAADMGHARVIDYLATMLDMQGDWGRNYYAARSEVIAAYNLTDKKLGVYSILGGGYYRRTPTADILPSILRLPRLEWFDFEAVSVIMQKDVPKVLAFVHARRHAVTDFLDATARDTSVRRALEEAARGNDSTARKLRRVHEALKQAERLETELTAGVDHVRFQRSTLQALQAAAADGDADGAVAAKLAHLDQVENGLERDSLAKRDAILSAIAIADSDQLP
jgi:hypothetical protein